MIEVAGDHLHRPNPTETKVCKRTVASSPWNAWTNLLANLLIKPGDCVSERIDAALKPKAGQATYGPDLVFAVAAERHSDTAGIVPASQLRGSRYCVEFHMFSLWLLGFPQGSPVSSYPPKPTSGWTVQGVSLPHAQLSTFLFTAPPPPNIPKRNFSHTVININCVLFQPVSCTKDGANIWSAGLFLLRNYWLQMAQAGLGLPPGLEELRSIVIYSIPGRMEPLYALICLWHIINVTTTHMKFIYRTGVVHSLLASGQNLPLHICIALASLGDLFTQIPRALAHLLFISAGQEIRQNFILEIRGDLQIASLAVQRPPPGCTIILKSSQYHDFRAYLGMRLHSWKTHKVFIFFFLSFLRKIPCSSSKKKWFLFLFFLHTFLQCNFSNNRAVEDFPGVRHF